MSLSHIPAAAVLAAMELDRSDNKDALEATWISLGCDAFKGKAMEYLLAMYRSVCNRIDRSTGRALDLARAI